MINIIAHNLKQLTQNCMRHLFFSFFSLSAICLTQQVHALEASYAHTYEDVSKKNTDQFGLGHTFDSGIMLGVEIKALAREQENGQAGRAFSHDEIYAEKYKLKYIYNVTPRYELTPELELEHKDEANKYKAKLVNTYRITDTQKIYFKYRYELVKYKDEAKPDKHANLFEVAASQSWKRFKLSYLYGYYHADTAIYNKKDTDYKHEVNLSYRATKKWTPYIEIRNESLSSKSKQRQTIFETGIQYRFF